MSDYISREAALDPGIKVSGLTYGEAQAVKAVSESYMAYLKNLPAAEVKPVVRGYWWTYKDEDTDCNGNLLVWCSECGVEDHQIPGKKVPFCWNCGAQMKAVVEKRCEPPTANFQTFGNLEDDNT